MRPPNHTSITTVGELLAEIERLPLDAPVEFTLGHPDGSTEPVQGYATTFGHRVLIHVTERKAR